MMLRASACALPHERAVKVAGAALLLLLLLLLLGDVYAMAA